MTYLPPWGRDMGEAARTAARVAAYDLFEAVQGAGREEAAAQVSVLLADAECQDWPEVALVLCAAELVHRLSRPDTHGDGAPLAQALVARAEQLQAPALLALSLGLRALRYATVGDTGALLVDACRALSLLDDATQPPMDRCAGYLVVGASLNTLRLWELVDEAYSAATALIKDCPAPSMTTALLINRVITRVEWALALMEAGDDPAAQARLVEAADAVPQALAGGLPPLWRLVALALADVVEALSREPDEALLAALGQHRLALAEAGDVEALPLVDAAIALSCRRMGRLEAAQEAAARLAPMSSSSGARSFPLWVRALVLAGEAPSGAVQAGIDHARLVARLRWESRAAVLAAARALVAVERRNAELARLSLQVRTDPLTGLGNRSIFESWLSGRADRRPGDTALLLLDIDGFKKVNDNHGHDVGDAVLRRVGAVLGSQVRPGDRAARIGGDEFVVLLSDERLPLEVVRERAVALRAAVASQPWGDLALGLQVTVSVGVAVAAIDAEGASTPASLYKRADGALYASKRDGSGLGTAYQP